MSVLKTESRSMHELQWTVVAEIREFSNVISFREYDVHPIFDHDTSTGDFVPKYVIAVYPNGYDEYTEGTVSVSFRNLDVLNAARHHELICTIAVVDVEGGRRHQRSFVMASDVWSIAERAFSIDNYISRSALLREPSEFLPNDTLTLHLEVILREQPFGRPDFTDEDYSGCHRCFTVKEGPGGMENYLRLDTDLVRRLVGESRYFQRMLDTPMRERSSRRMRLPDDECRSFKYIRNILLAFPTSTLSAVDEIFDLYSAADKYDIPVVLDTCRCWLKLCLCRRNFTDISNFAVRCGDDCLQEAVETFLRSERDGEERVALGDNFQSCAIRTSGEWTCQPFKDEGLSGFTFTRRYQFGDGKEAVHVESEDGKKGKTREKELFDFYF